MDDWSEALLRVSWIIQIIVCTQALCKMQESVNDIIKCCSVCVA